MRTNGFPRLKQFRSEIKLSQRDFASSIGLNLSTYNNYETGAREPSSDFWIAISKKYNVSIDFLLGLTNENFPVVEPQKGGLEPDEHDLVADYRLLNASGKEAARSAVHGFTLAPNYKKSTESKFFEENA